MPSALWQGRVIAESDRFETMEGNIYSDGAENIRDDVAFWRGVTVRP